MSETSQFEATSHAPNAGLTFAATGVTIAPCPPATRLILRGAPQAYAAHIRMRLPTSINASASAANRHALMLGPDEWLVIDQSADDLPMPDDMDGVCTAVDVSHRQTGWIVSGETAAATLSVGCPRDLRDSAFPAGACARTIFGKAEISLYRSGEQEWRVECWRSFAPYVFRLLKEGARDAGL